jgi:catechol 2,3-dioxygenase-like lactoylglutathione lyase family enzyme
MTFRVTGFNHTAFTVGDLNAVLPFFVDGLGFKLISRGPRNSTLLSAMTGIPGVELEIAYVEGPGHWVELIQYKAPPGRATVRPRLYDAGAAHLALDVDNIDAAVETAARYGFNSPGAMITSKAGPSTGRRVIYVRNDEGLTIEFMETAP